MTAPIPLTKPDGTVHAYACGHCGFLHCGWSHGGGWNERDADRTRTEAERCCTCHKCSAFIGSSVRYSCETCDAAWAAEMAKRDAEHAALATESVAAEDAEHYTLTVNGHALDVAVEDEFGVYTRATVRHRDADDPTRNGDWSESSRCGEDAVSHAVAYTSPEEAPECADVAAPRLARGLWGKKGVRTYARVNAELRDDGRTVYTGVAGHTITEGTGGRDAVVTEEKATSGAAWDALVEELRAKGRR